MLRINLAASYLHFRHRHGLKYDVIVRIFWNGGWRHCVELTLSSPTFALYFLQNKWSWAHLLSLYFFQFNELIPALSPKYCQIIHIGFCHKFWGKKKSYRGEHGRRLTFGTNELIFTGNFLRRKLFLGECYTKQCIIDLKKKIKKNINSTNNTKIKQKKHENKNFGHKKKYKRKYEKLD